VILVLNVERAHGGDVAIRGADERTAGLMAELRLVLPAETTRRQLAAAQRRARSSQPSLGMLKDLETRIAFFGLTIIAVAALPAKRRSRAARTSNRRCL
jgi:hypothetical protein